MNPFALWPLRRFGVRTTSACGLEKLFIKKLTTHHAHKKVTIQQSQTRFVFSLTIQNTNACCFFFFLCKLDFLFLETNWLETNEKRPEGVIKTYNLIYMYLKQMHSVNALINLQIHLVSKKLSLPAWKNYGSFARPRDPRIE